MGRGTDGHLEEELAVLDVLDGLGRRGVEARAVWPAVPCSPAFVRIERPDKLVAARVLLRVAVLALGRGEARDRCSREHADEHTRELLSAFAAGEIWRCM